MARPTICVVSPVRDAYSETFIRAHIENLPANVKLLYGGCPPVYYGNGSLIASPFTLRRHLAESIERRVRGLGWDDFRRRDLVRVLKGYSAQAVLAEYGPTGVAVMDACAEADLPLIVHFHGYDAHSRETLETVGVRYPALFRKCSAIVAVSRHMEQHLLSLGAPRDKLHYNPCGVDTDLFACGNPASVPPVFLSVGRFVDKKAPYLTLLAFSRVLAQIPIARLVMVGDGPLWDTCKRLAQVYGIESSIDMLGSRPHHEVAALMQQARAFVQHSVVASSGDSEGTPVAVLEACASGLPVVATQHAGIPDVVTDGESGFLVEEGDIDGMAEHMIQLAENPLLATKVGQAGRKRVCADFSMRESIDGLWHIIERVVQARD